jgi:hypothetical protein
VLPRATTSPRERVTILADAARLEGAKLLQIVGHEKDPSALLAFGSSLAELETIQRQLASLLRDRGLTATRAVDRWSNAETQWQQIRGADDREARMGRHGLDDSQITFSARTLGPAAAVLLAAAGITFYAITPYTFGAFQASTFGIMAPARHRAHLASQATTGVG